MKKPGLVTYTCSPAPETSNWRISEVSGQLVEQTSELQAQWDTVAQEIMWREIE